MLALTMVVGSGCSANDEAASSSADFTGAPADAAAEAGPALSDDAVRSTATALGEFLKQTHEAVSGETLVGTDRDGVRSFANGFVTAASDDGELFTSPGGYVFRKVTTTDGEPVAALAVGWHALNGYSLTLIDPRSGGVYFSDTSSLRKITGPVTPPEGARLVGALSPAQMEIAAKAINMAILGQDHV